MGTQLYFGDEPVGGSGGGSTPGPPGASAYEVAVENGYVGTETEWLESLQGEPGETGADSIVPGPQGDPFTYDDFTPEQLEDLKGPAGDPASISTWGELAQKA